MKYEKYKESIKKYRQSEKGKKAQLRANKKWQENNPDKVKEYNQKYLNSEKGKTMKREANRRYREKMKQKKSTI